MRNVRVRYVERYRDGGTTHVETAEGTLFSPTPFNRDAKPSWAGEELEQLDSSQFVISESAAGVTIDPR